MHLVGSKYQFCTYFRNKKKTKKNKHIFKVQNWKSIKIFISTRDFNMLIQYW